MNGSNRLSRTVQTLSLCVATALGFQTVEAQEKPKAGEKITFDDHVKPIFRAKCFSCHSTDKKTADLDLSNYTAMMQGGASGTAVEPGSAEDSYLWMLVNHDTEPYMPPKSDKLPGEMLATIKKWIDLGALENSGSKAMIKKKNPSLTLDSVPSGKPEGPAAMPRGVLIDPVLHTSRPAAVKALATSPWAPLVAVAAPKQVVLFDSKTKRNAGVLPFEEGDPYVLRFSRNGELLMAAGGRGAAKGLAVVWSVRTGERLFDVGDELDAVLAADISADQSMIAIGGTNRLVRVYDTSTGEVLYEIKKHTDWVTALEFSPDGVLLATGDRNGGMHVWEAYTGRLYSTLGGHKAATTGVSWRGDSNILGSCSEDGTIKLWEMENGKAVKSWTAHGGGALGLEFARDGRIVSSGRDKVCKLWAQDGKQLVAFPGFADIATRATFDDETNTAIAGDLSGAIRAWNAADPKQVVEVHSNPIPLDERIALATKDAAALKAAMDKAVAETSAMKQQLEKSQAALTASNQKKAGHEATIKKLNAEMPAVKKTVDALTAKHATDSSRLAAFKAAIPMLKESLKQASAAVAQLKDDKELAATAEQLKKFVAERESGLKTLEASVPKTADELAKAKQRLQQQVDGVKSNTEAVAAVAKLIETQTKAVSDQKATTDSLQAAANEATAKFEAQQGVLNRFKLYATLRSELKSLEIADSEFQVKEQGMAEVVASVEKAAADMKTMESELEKTSTMLGAAQKTVAGLKKSIADTTANATAMTVQKQTIEKALPVLTASLKQAQEASGILSQDAEVKAVSVAVETLLNKKKAEVVELGKKMAAAAQKKAADEKALTLAEKSVVELQQKVATSKQQHKEAVVAFEEKQQLKVKTESELVALKKRLDSVRSRVEGVRDQISPPVEQNQQAAAN